MAHFGMTDQFAVIIESEHEPVYPFTQLYPLLFDKNTVLLDAIPDIV
jgi:hypothetical protein